MSGSESTQTTPDTPDTSRRRWSPLVVGSVAAAVLLAGGGGVYVSTAGSGGGADDRSAPAAEGPPPPLRLDSLSGDGPGIAPGEPDPSGAVYKARGKLPEGPDAAHVHHARGAVTEDEVARLAKALGVAGTPKLVGSAWKIAPPKDGFGPLLQVDAEAPGTWTFSQYDGAPKGDNCLKGKPCPGGAGGAAAGASGTPVGEEAAKKAAAPVLAAVGQADADKDAAQVMGSVRVVNAAPRIGGLPTYGWSTGIQVGSDGRVVGGSGQLKKPEQGHRYPVVGAEKALAELNKASKGAGPIGIGGCATAPPASVHGTETGGKPDTRPEAPCEAAADRVPPREMTVLGAEFGLAAQHVEGRQALVPAWLFEVADENAKARPFTIAQTAVAPEHLTPRPTPSPTPTPVPVPSDDAAPPRQLQAYSVDSTGRKLTVTFWGGVCSDYAASAQESAERVTVTITETPRNPDRACIAIAVEVTKTVTLKEPLGDRQVVDAASGDLVPRAD
ncbi:hypothetical protein [Streptomyces purpureus]|uniref:hypothetical protein n=1 Tax=Streptomyces purpureus TaxID=1951 RepID=UPI000363B92D|nr:hypothetical protein [Streptomyces purpureus]